MTRTADRRSPTRPAPNAPTRPALWMISGALCFAVMGTLTHALGPRCDWLTIALVRVVFMFASALLAARLAGVRLVFRRPVSLWPRSLAGSFSLVCTFYALTRLPVGDVLTLTNTYPLWVFALACLEFRRRPAAADLLGVVCGLVGVALIGRPHLGGDGRAAVVALAGSLGTAVAMVNLHRLRGVDPRAVVAHFAGVATVILGGWALARWSQAGPSTSAAAAAGAAGAVDVTLVLMLAGVGLTGTVGQVFLTKAYAAGPPTRVAVLGLTQVVFGVGFDALVWRRALGPLTLAGTALVLAPTAWLLARGGGVGGGAVVAGPADGSEPAP